ncbi:MAG: LacI family DNA-binding transcriptional regulator [Armatimonadota bacterium]
MVTVRELARSLGVSIASVSRALSDKPGVSGETRRRIRELAERYSYPPHRLGVSLDGASANIGCLVPSISAPFFSRALQAMIHNMAEEPYQLVPFQSFTDPLNTEQAIHAMIRQRVRGALLAPGQMQQISASSILEFRSHGIPVVGMNFTQSELPIDQVHTDEGQLARLAVESLVRLGHRRIAYIGQVTSGNAVSRAEALRETLLGHGLPTTFFIHWPDSAAIKDDLLAGLLRQANPPTAIITFCSSLAGRILQQTGDMGITVPRDLSILSCSYHPQITPYLAPPLTGIDEQPEEVGRQACKLLFDRLAAGPGAVPVEPITISVSPRLVEGKSCAPPPKTTAC